jgi:CRP-like cAMP-binding protein
VAEAVCKKAAETNQEVDNASLRIIRAIKPLRWFKIARVMKLGKAGPLVLKIMDYYNISPKQGKTLKVGVMLLGGIHMISCVFWLWKVVGSCEGTDSDGNPLLDPATYKCPALEQFLDDQDWGANPRNGLETSQGKLEAYIISVYVITMTLTTVGYGDIAAYNTAERVGYTVLFIVGAFIWGTLLAEINDIHVSSSAREQERMCKVQKTLEFLVQNDVPSNLRTTIIQWTRFHEDNQDDHGFKQEVIHFLPPNLQKELVRHLYSRAVSRVPVFAYLESVDDNCSAADALQEMFVSEVFILFEYKTYTPGDILINFSDSADRLVIILSGKLLVEFEHSKIDRDDITLGPDQCFGDMAILQEMGMRRDWADSSSFNFLPHDTDTHEHTEIRVSAAYDYVVTVQLHADKFKTYAAFRAKSLTLELNPKHTTTSSPFSSPTDTHVQRYTDTSTYTHRHVHTCTLYVVYVYVCVCVCVACLCVCERGRVSDRRGRGEGGERERERREGGREGESREREREKEISF